MNIFHQPEIPFHNPHERRERDRLGQAVRPHIQPIRDFRKQITAFHRPDQNISLVKEAGAMEIQLFENFLPIHHRAVGVIEIDQECGVDDEAVDVGKAVAVK